MIRVLYIPLFTNKNIGGCASYNSSKVLLMNMVERHEDVVFYYPYPDDPTYDLTALDFIEHERIIKIPMSVIGNQTQEIFYVPADLIKKFRSFDGEYICDVLVCEKQRVSFMAHLFLNDHYKAAKWTIPLVNFHQFQSVKEAHMKGTSDEFEYSQIFGAMSGWNIYGCKTMFGRLMKSSSKWFRPSILKRIEERSCFDVSSVIDCDRIDLHSEEKSRDEIRVNFGTRINSQYFLDEIVDEYDLAYKAGRNARFVITSPGKSGQGGRTIINDMTKRGFTYDLHERVKQNDFYRIASQCHIAPYFGKNGELGLSIRERAYMGLAPLIPDAPIFSEMFPTWKWKYKDSKERKILLRFLMENYWGEEVQEQLAILREDMRLRYDGKIVADKYHDFLVRVDESARGDVLRVVKKRAEFLKELFDEFGWPAEVTQVEFRQWVIDHTRNKKDIDVLFTGETRRAYRLAMFELGYADIGTSSPLYKKN